MAICVNEIREMGTEEFIDYVQALYSNPIVPIDEFNPDTVEINGKVWTAKPISLDDNGRGIYVHSFSRGNYYTADAIDRIVSKLPQGWRVPTVDDFFDAACSMGASKEWKYYNQPSDDMHEKYYQHTSKFLACIGGYQGDCFIENSIGDINTNYSATDLYFTSTIDKDDNSYCLVEVKRDDNYPRGIIGDYRMYVPYFSAKKRDAFKVLLIRDK
jgi:hypothetical protein